MSRTLDLVGEAVRGLRARPLRSALCAGGIALGMAAMVAVVAIPATTRQALLNQLGQDGNLLTVSSGNTIDNQPAPLPSQSPAMLRRIPGVQQLSPVAYQSGWIARRTPFVPVADTNGLAVIAVSADLTATLDLHVTHGAFLDAATSRYPAVVLGSGAARALGMSTAGPNRLVTLSTADGRRTVVATVLGILADAPLAPELDSAVLIGDRAAHTRLDAGGGPSRIYLRADPDKVGPVHALLAATTSPEDPGAVQVGRPSDLLAARLTAQNALNDLAFGLGAVALLVGGVGVANAMVVSVLERRSEIGLRRALGAGRGFVGGLILIESTLLCLSGALAGGIAGLAVTWVAAMSQAVAVQVPLLPVGLGLAASVLVGLIAGLYPALRAAQLAPAAALRIAG
ncbi:ABC transporter permease [Kribbella sp. NPDC000426]|uniref:ABC transporter permease n=1 Tax=Kribbella sp. NPDC000426 TaxID=3154255 RepID=UPI0033215B32